MGNTILKHRTWLLSVSVCVCVFTGNAEEKITATIGTLSQGSEKVLWKFPELNRKPHFN